MKAYRVTHGDCDFYYAAETRGKARYMAASDICSAAWTRTRGEALVELTCLRAPEYDTECRGLSAEGQFQPKKVEAVAPTYEEGAR